MDSENEAVPTQDLKFIIRQLGEKLIQNGRNIHNICFVDLKKHLTE